MAARTVRMSFQLGTGSDRERTGDGSADGQWIAGRIDSATVQTAAGPIKKWTIQTSASNMSMNGRTHYSILGSLQKAPHIISKEHHREKQITSRSSATSARSQGVHSHPSAGIDIAAQIQQFSLQFRPSDAESPERAALSSTKAPTPALHPNPAVSLSRLPSRCILTLFSVIPPRSPHAHAPLVPCRLICRPVPPLSFAPCGLLTTERRTFWTAKETAKKLIPFPFFLVINSNSTLSRSSRRWSVTTLESSRCPTSPSSTDDLVRPFLSPPRSWSFKNSPADVLFTRCLDRSRSYHCSIHSSEVNGGIFQFRVEWGVRDVGARITILFQDVHTQPSPSRRPVRMQPSPPFAMTFALSVYSSSRLTLLQRCSKGQGNMRFTASRVIDKLPPWPKAVRTETL